MTNKNLLTLDSVKELIGRAAEVVQDRIEVGSLVRGNRLVGTSTETMRRVSPADQSLAFTNVFLDESGTREAIAAVREGFDQGVWGQATDRTRSQILWNCAQHISANADRVATLLVVEAGKPIGDARGEVQSIVNSLEYFSGLARTQGGRTEQSISDRMLAMTLREPAGVAGLLIPWNFPIGILGQKLPPALAAGNTAVIKPSPFTTLSALAVAELMFEAGLPVDALSVVVGDVAAGSQIVSHVDTDVISFTGSTGVGRIIAAQAGTNRLKPVAIEAGGKTPVVVFADADLDATIEGIMFSAYFNVGQVCVAGSRILVHEDIAQEFNKKLVKRVKQLRVGSPWDESTQVGPLVSVEHRDQVVGAVAKALKQGATLLAGETSAAIGQSLPTLEPIVLMTQDDQNSAIRSEIFGPVTTVQTFKTLEEVVERANAQQYGLALSVWGSDIDQLLTLSRMVRVGTVWINGSTDSYPELPLGGRRDSGFGAEFGREGMDFFTSLKTVIIRTGGVEEPRFS